MSHPWLVEESWLRAMIDSFNLEGEFLPGVLDTVSSEQIKTTFNAKRYGDGSIAVLPISGPIFPKPNFLTKYLGIGVSLETFISDLKTLDKDPEIKTIIFDIDSPGGVVTGVNEASSIIKNISTKTISYVSGSAASAAYWLGSSADEIVLEATGRVGSIGVVVALPNPQEEKKWTIEMVNTKSPNKRPDISTDKGKKEIITLLDSLADVFISAVAENRKVSADTVVNDFGQGGMLVGQSAVDKGMADKLGFFEDLIVSLQENSDHSTQSSQTQSPQQSLKIKNTIKIKGEKEMKITLDTLKAENKETYDKLVAEVKDSLKGDYESRISEKDTKIASLEETISASSKQNEGLLDRVQALEKKDMLQQEKNMKEKADTIMLTKLVKSSVPERLHEKIKSLVNYNKFVSDGVFDAKSFGEAVDIEVKEFEDFVSESTTNFVDGIKTHSFNPTNDDVNAGADDSLVDKMMDMIN